MTDRDDLARIDAALARAREVLREFTPGAIEFTKKRGGDPVTEADHAVDRVLRETLPRAGEGWLSEETVDDRARLDLDRVWIVDPIDGTKEFVSGIPEWCVSIGLVVSGRPVAGGILNPATGELVVGAVGNGVFLGGRPAGLTAKTSLDGAVVLASRSEIRRGEWERHADDPFEVRPCGSVAYKLALVAAGLADATWTLTPKNEWDVAGGAALVVAGGGRIWHPTGEAPRFNARDTRLPGFVACPEGLVEPIRATLSAG